MTRLLQAVMEQQRWIDEHGRTLAGYRECYGKTPGYCADEIYQADTARLDTLKAQYARFVRRNLGTSK